MSDLTILEISIAATVILCIVIFRAYIFRRIQKVLQQIPTKRHASGQARSIHSFKDLEKKVQEWSEERNDEIQRLEKLENYRREYLGNVSHELKTPIFNIQGYISTLLDGGLEDPSVNRAFLNKAMNSVDRMIAIVEDLQTITQLEKGELEIEEETFDIISLLHDIIDAQELKAGEKQIRLELKNDPSQPIFVLADRFRIRQAIVNLVVNSVRYGKQNGKTSLKASDAGDKVIVEIADTGIGIPKEHLDRIFERFYRVDKSRSRDQGGTGLGLSIVKHILEAHGQTISVMSTEGVGTVFSFTLKKSL